MLDRGNQPGTADTAFADRVLKATEEGCLDRSSQPSLRPGARATMPEATMDILLLRAIAAAGTRLAFSNGWRYGAPVPAGPVAVNDLWNIIPISPPVSAVALTGAEVRAMLEENLERTFAAGRNGAGRLNRRANGCPIGHGGTTKGGTSALRAGASQAAGARAAFSRNWS